MPMLVMMQRLRCDGKTVAFFYGESATTGTACIARTGWAGSEGRGQHGQGVDFGLCRMKYFTVLTLGSN